MSILMYSFTNHLSPFCSMVSSMATTKVTITLQDEQLEEIRALVNAGEAASVSGFVQHAVTVASSRCGRVERNVAACPGPNRRAAHKKRARLDRRDPGRQQTEERFQRR